MSFKIHHTSDYLFLTLYYYFSLIFIMVVFCFSRGFHLIISLLYPFSLDIHYKGRKWKKNVESWREKAGKKKRKKKRAEKVEREKEKK
jgi:cytochrome b subunit of formate dehydrogenase